jgi:hypothetical protein
MVHNFKTLYHIEYLPSDSYLRERLDELDPKKIRPAFKKVFAKLQRDKHLEKFIFMDKFYLLDMDGSGWFSSSCISCQFCCEKNHASGVKSYYHQVFGACIVHPDRANVIPFCPEIIQKGDGETKNDCERNAAKRFLENFRREHPHLDVIVIEDGLASNAPHIALLEQYNMKYIIGAKPGDHKFLFDSLENSTEVKYYELIDENGTLHQFRYLNRIGLNKSNQDLKVNLLEYRQTTTDGKELTFSWVTNLWITNNNVFEIMRGGRARWKVENEKFNALKNLGYNFEHNYGHGKKHLSTVFCYLMILAFLIDQAQEIACSQYQFIRKVARTYQSLWKRIEVLFEYLKVDHWETFYLVIAKKKFVGILEDILDTC